MVVAARVAAVRSSSFSRVRRPCGLLCEQLDDPVPLAVRGLH